MNTFVLSPLQQSMAQRSAGKNIQRGWYMTVLVIKHGIMKFISIRTVVSHLMIKCDVDTPWDCFRQDVKWTLAIG
jgi:hypothetical protein